jgi:hypothetical protein
MNDTLKITITADNKQAVQNIQETAAATTQMGDAFNKVPATSRQATNALSNLSRVAQDAPYGFIAIQNNLNPLLESFQRLREEATATGTSLTKSLISALSGPAGIGVALGVAGAAGVMFSKQISEAFKKPTDDLKKFREELLKLNDDIFKIIGGANANQAVALNLTQVIVGGSEKEAKNALKLLQEIYSKSAEIKNAKLGKDQQYYIDLVNIAANQEKAIGKEKLNEEELLRLYSKREELVTKRNKALKDAEKLEGIPGFPKAERIRSEKMSIGYNFDTEIAKLEADIVKVRIKNTELVAELSKFQTPDTKDGRTKEDKKDPFEELTKDFEKSLRAQETLRSKGIISQQEYFDNVYKIYLDYINKLAELDTKKATDKIDSLIPKFDKMTLEKNAKEIKDGIDKILASYKEPAMEVPKDTAIEDAKKEHEDYLKWLTDWTKWKEKLALKNIEKEKDKTQQLKDSYERFAQTIANTVTNALVTMYDAMQKGEDPLQAIGQMFANIGRQIAAAVVQALIFKALLDAFPELKGVFTAIGGASGGIGGLLGLASGGVVTGPTLAMIGEGSESEAVLPLSKLGGMLNTTFNAGAMNSNQTNGNSSFVLRGQDLLLSINRAQKASNLKGQNISLA